MIRNAVSIAAVIVRNTGLICLLLLSVPDKVAAQYGSFSDRPKLFVQIIVGQMSNDVVLKLKNEFDGAGIRTLVSDGVYCSQASFSHPYVFASSSIATIVTGAHPSMHGVSGDTYYDRKTRRTESSESLEVPAFSDELGRISPSSKIISLAFQRQPAMLAGGQRPGWVYWFDENLQKFMCLRAGKDSRVHPEILPDWARQMNEKQFAGIYSEKIWTSQFPRIKYDALPENVSIVPFSEGKIYLGAPKNKKSAPLLRETPFADNLIKDFAVAAIEGEQLGADGYTDVLSIYWDASRQVGNKFGLHSAELQDTYYRLDENIATLVKYLNEKVGKDQYLLCLTADAGGQACDDWMVEQQEFRSFEPIKAHLLLNTFLGACFGKGEWVESVHDNTVFLNRDLIEKAKLTLSQVQEKSVDLLLQMEGVKFAFQGTKIPYMSPEMPFAAALAHTYKPQGADVMFVLKPGWTNAACENKVQSGYYPQLHVPLFWYGWRFRPQTVSAPIDMNDLVWTLCTLMDVPVPSGTQGKPIKALAE